MSRCKIIPPLRARVQPCQLPRHISGNSRCATRFHFPGSRRSPDAKIPPSSPQKSDLNTFPCLLSPRSGFHQRRQPRRCPCTQQARRSKAQAVARPLRLHFKIRLLIERHCPCLIGCGIICILPPVQVEFVECWYAHANTHTFQ